MRGVASTKANSYGGANRETMKKLKKGNGLQNGFQGAFETNARMKYGLTRTRAGTKKFGVAESIACARVSHRNPRSAGSTLPKTHRKAHLGAPKIKPKRP